jgi:hypothetical protein
MEMSSLQDDALTAVREEFAEWRRAKKGRTVPDSLWLKAIALLETHKQSHVCELLGVNSNRLAMKRFELTGVEPAARNFAKKPSKQRFVELQPVVSEAPRTLAGGVATVKVVAEKADGAKLTFEIPAIDSATVGTIFERFFAPAPRTTKK